MSSSNLPSFLFSLLCLISTSVPIVLGQEISSERDGLGGGGGGGRALMSFKETPSGGNVTFECSPSGPCVACQYSEKNEKKYRCSETGYRIPLKCVEIGSGKKEANTENAQRRHALENSGIKSRLKEMLHDMEEVSTSMRQRSLLDDSSTSDHKSQAYISYRSCVPAVNEEKLSILGFEVIVLGLLLMSGSFVYFRRKQNRMQLQTEAKQYCIRNRSYENPYQL